MRNQRNSKALALFILTLTGITGCSTGQPKKEKEENDAMRAQVTEMKTLVSTMTSKVDGLETKLSGMSEKLEASRLSLETYLANQRPKPAPVVVHPSASAGTEIDETPADSDPEAGFTHDQAVSAYQKAQVLFQSQKYPEATLAFAAFLEVYPDHPLAGSAQFFIGESYLRQKEYKLALIEFQKVLTSYDRSSHVADTLRAMAEAEEIVKRPDDAARHRQLLTSLFPQSPAAMAKNDSAAETMENSNSAAVSETPAALDSAPRAPVSKPDAPAVSNPSTSPSTSGVEKKSEANTGGGAALDETPPPTAPMTQKAP